MSGPRRWVLICLGFLFVGLGTVGMFVPILPTTPFLLLAAFFFARSSERFYHWLMNHKLFGPYLRNYREHKAMTLRAKIITLSVMWLAIGYVVLFTDQSLLVDFILVLIAVGVTVHIVRLRTAR